MLRRNGQQPRRESSGTTSPAREASRRDSARRFAEKPRCGPTGRRGGFSVLRPIRVAPNPCPCCVRLHRKGMTQGPLSTRGEKELSVGPF